MRLAEVMTPSVEIVPPDMPVAEAAARLRDLDRDVLPVGDGGRVVGLLVGRDIVERATARGHDPRTAPVREVMLADVVYGYADQDVSEAVRLMRERKLAQLIVLDRDHRLVGLVSLADLAPGSAVNAEAGAVLAHLPEPAHQARPVYKRILVPLDGSELAEHVLPHALVLAATFGATVTLLRATPLAEALAAAAPGAVPFPGALPTGSVIDPLTLVETERREGQVYLTALAERLRSEGLSVDVAQPEGSPAAAIIATARQQGTDLIALTSHGRSGLGRLVFGSVADAVLRSAPCPLLVVRVSDEGRHTTA